MSEFDKIIGYEDIKEKLIRLCDVIKNYEKYEKLGVNYPRGILLYGEPGLGKTSMANCFINEVGGEFFVLRKDDPNGEFVTKIKKTYEMAKSHAPAIVLLDDVDKFANADELHPDAEEYVTVQSCIDECRGSKVFTLATANNMGALPKSLRRVGRFDEVIYLRTPEGKESREILEYYLKTKKVVRKLDIEEVTGIVEGKTCAELEAIVNEVGIYAGYEDRNEIEQKDIIRACMKVLYDAYNSCDKIDEKSLRRIATHEVGHAVVTEHFLKGRVGVISLWKGNNGRGVCKNRGLDDYICSNEQMQQEVMIALGGKAANEVVFGEVDMGSDSDIRKAYEMVEIYVDGLSAYNFRSTYYSEASNYKLENRDRQIDEELERLYNESKKVIMEERTLLDALVEELIKKHLLTCRDVAKVRKKLKI